MYVYWKEINPLPPYQAETIMVNSLGSFIKYFFSAGFWDCYFAHILKTGSQSLGMFPHYAPAGVSLTVYFNSPRPGS